MPNPTITHPVRDNDQVDEANLQIRWNNISDVRFFVSIRNLTTDRVVVSNQETTTNSFTFQMAHLTPGNRFRVAVNAVEFGGSGAPESTWAERVFVVRAISITSGRVVHSRIIQQPDSMGHNLTSERQLTAINRIAVHHSASGTNHNPTITNINNWWIGHEWTRSGYHFIIRGDGSIWQLVPIHALSNGVGGQNTPLINVAFAGTFTSTTLPMVNARNSYGFLCRLLLGSTQLPNLNALTHIVGHNTFPNHGTNACPGVTQAQYRSWV